MVHARATRSAVLCGKNKKLVHRNLLHVCVIIAVAAVVMVVVVVVVIVRRADFRRVFVCVQLMHARSNCIHSDVGCSRVRINAIFHTNHAPCTISATNGLLLSKYLLQLSLITNNESQSFVFQIEIKSNHRCL